MAKRTDVHSEKSLRPEDYQVQEYLYTKLPPLGFDLTAAGLGAYKAMMDEFRATMNRVNDLLQTIIALRQENETLRASLAKLRLQQRIDEMELSSDDSHKLLEVASA